MSENTENFPVIDLEGNFDERIKIYGERCSKRITRTFDYYWNLFTRRFKPEWLIATSHEFLKNIDQFNSDYAQEIKILARYSGLESWQLTLINARSEIHRSLESPTECTAVAYPKQCVLGENWDWDQSLEKLAVVLRVKRDDAPSYLSIVEPGMFAKIGMNSAGVGVCLNILKCSEPTGAVPIHILIRMLMDCTSVEEAVEKVMQAPRATTSHLFIADKSGTVASIELAGKLIEVRKLSSPILHTNHYVWSTDIKGAAASSSSIERYKRAVEIVTTQTPLSSSQARCSLEAVLSDQENKQWPICRSFNEDFDGQTIGTVCSVILDLAGNRMFFTPGNPKNNLYRELSLPQ